MLSSMSSADVYLAGGFPEVDVMSKALKDRPWTYRQRIAIDLLAQGHHNYTGIADKVGVSRNTLHKWRQRPAFQEAVYQGAMKLLEDDLPDILGALSQKAQARDVKAIELALKHLGRYTEKSTLNLEGKGTLEVEVDLSELSMREDESGD